MSIKRKVVTTKHKDEIDDMYDAKKALTKSSDGIDHLGGQSTFVEKVFYIFYCPIDFSYRLDIT